MKNDTDPSKKTKQVDPPKKQQKQEQIPTDKPEVEEDIINTAKKVVNSEDEDVVINKQDHVD